MVKHKKIEKKEIRDRIGKIRIIKRNKNIKEKF